MRRNIGTRCNNEASKQAFVKMKNIAGTQGNTARGGILLKCSGNPQEYYMLRNIAKM